jgi:serine-type D-Ala-D-Ala carboxypeptidase/endopeptidase (penicillin-binding protein 4)
MQTASTRLLRLPLLLALAAVFAACATAPARPVAPAASLALAIDSVLQRPQVQRASWGVLVQDAATGAVLYSRDAGRLFIPASNMKLVVSVTALGRLGPEWRYRTRLLSRGAGGGHAAAVIVVGAGDPTWSARFHGDVAAPFDSLVALVAAAGIRSLDTLLIDVSRFRDEPIHPTWEVSDLPGIYAPPVDAFAAGEGTFRLALLGGPLPGSEGVALVLEPLHQPVRAAVLTDTAGARASVAVDFLARRDTVHLTARVAAGAADTVSLALTRPAESAAAALHAAFQRRGMVIGAVRLVRDTAEAARQRNGASELGAVVSPPMSAIVAAILRPSQNWIAEQVLKSLGAEFHNEGSWRGGNFVARSYLVGDVGVDSSAFLLRDASGMSAQNLLSPVTVVAVLAHARAQPWSETFRTALAQPGLSGSTLSGRLRALEGRVFAKTGSITNVNSLSGYFVAADGREYLFSVLSNASGVPASVVRTAIDDVVLALARHLDAR